MVSGAGLTCLAPVSPDALAAALDVLHQAALAIAIPPPPRPDLETASAESLRRHVVNLEAESERRTAQIVRMDQERSRLRGRVRALEGALHNIVSSSNDGASIEAASAALGLSIDRTEG